MASGLGQGPSGPWFFNLIKDEDMNDNDGVIRVGLSLGSVLAIVCSWSINKSILWAIIHSIFGWFYVLYYAIKYV